MEDTNYRSDWRYERKFRLQNIPRRLALQIVRHHPAGFLPVFPDRWVNNLYFDDVALTALNDNFGGVAERQKVRLRWYGEAFPAGAQPARLEWKLRLNQLGMKEARELPPVFFDSLAGLGDAIGAVWPEGRAYRLALLNRYRRSYFATAGGRLRLTVDWNMRFSEPHAGFQARRLHLALPGGVLELKYARQDEDYASWVMQHLPFPASKNSKYVAGLLALNYR